MHNVSANNCINLIELFWGDCPAIFCMVKATTFYKMATATDITAGEIISIYRHINLKDVLSQAFSETPNTHKGVHKN